MVSVQFSYTVTPSEPTPHEKFSSFCEQIKLRSHAPLLFVYKTHGHRDASKSKFAGEILRSSLSKALVPYYPLAGRLYWIEGEGGPWELHCNGKGAQILEAKCEAKLDDLGEFVPTQLVGQLMPNISYDCSIEEVPLLVVQLTRFPCGGLTIGVAVCRAVIDGTAAMSFINAWTKLARGENLDLTQLPCHDRNLLNSRKLQSALHHDQHSEFDPPPLWFGSFRETTAAVAVVSITRDQVKKLKEKVNNAPSRPYTSFEVIAGHLWRCVSKARYAGNGDQPTRLSTLINCRGRLRPRLPITYAGNTVFPTVTPTCTFDDLKHKPLSYAVGNVRQALEKLTDEYVRSTLDYIANHKDINLLRYNTHYPAAARSVQLQEGESESKGNPNLFVVSWMNFPFKGADFGWGIPVYFGPGYMDSEGKAFVVNNANGDGFIVAICLDASHMDGFKKLFHEDIEEGFPASKL